MDLCKLLISAGLTGAVEDHQAAPFCSQPAVPHAHICGASLKGLLSCI
jgi:hypothetical protein